MIEFVEVSHTYASGRQDMETFAGLSFFIPRGKLVAVIGPNGAGKSTILKLIRGLEAPSSGEVKVNGISTKSSDFASFAERHIGYIMENPKMQVVSNIVYEDIIFTLENLSVERDEAKRRIERVATELGIKELLRRPVESLSDGELQRVVLAGILVGEPEIILSDESTAWLDGKSALDVIRIFKRFCSQGKTVVHVTHNPQEMLMADCIAVVGKKRLLSFGPPREIFRNAFYLHELGISVPITALISELVLKTLPEKKEPALTPEELARWLS